MNDASNSSCNHPIHELLSHLPNLHRAECRKIIFYKRYTGKTRTPTRMCCACYRLRPKIHSMWNYRLQSTWHLSMLVANDIETLRCADLPALDHGIDGELDYNSAALRGKLTNYWSSEAISVKLSK